MRADPDFAAFESTAYLDDPLHSLSFGSNPVFTCRPPRREDRPL